MHSIERGIRVKTNNSRKTCFILRHSKLSIIFIYNLSSLIAMAIFYPIIPILMGYPMQVMELSSKVGISYDFQYLAATSLSIAAGTIFLLYLLRGIDKWQDAVAENNLELLKEIRKQCINIPYIIFIVQVALIGIIVPAIIGAVCLVNRTPFSQFLKISTVVFSLISLIAVFSHILSKRLFTKILFKTYKIYNGEGLQGRRISIRNKIFLQILPMIIVGILFISVLAYSKLVEEKGDLVYRLYKIQLNDVLKNQSDFQSTDELFEALKKIRLEDVKTGYFAVRIANGDIITSDGYAPGVYFSYLARNPVKGDRVFGDSFEMQGVVSNVKINGEDYFAGIRFDNSSNKTIIFFIIAFFALLALNIIALYFFSKSISDEISVVARGLIEIAEGDNVDLDRKLAVISNDELGDLVIAFNKIQEKEKENVREMEEKQSIIIEREKLAQDALQKLKQIQTQLIHQEKLAGIGQLAAGVAHEINTPLGFVSSNIETLKSYIMKYRDMLDGYRECYKNIKKLLLGESNAEIINKLEELDNLERKNKFDFINEDITDLFNDVSDGIERISRIVIGLRTFSRVDQQNEFAEYDLNNGIQNTLLVANNEIKYHAKVELVLGDIPTVIANGGQINQVLLNIIINAVHAIKFRDDVNSSLITIRTSSDNSFVVCEIEDNGIGIPENVISRVFDPFFTTKPVGQGTGLGLSIAYDIIVNKHKGKLCVDSKQGSGTKFTIKLPIKAKQILI